MTPHYEHAYPAGISGAHCSDVLYETEITKNSVVPPPVAMETLALTAEQLQLAKEGVSQRKDREEIVENGKGTGIYTHSRTDASAAVASACSRTRCCSRPRAVRA